MGKSRTWHSFEQYRAALLQPLQPLSAGLSHTTHSLFRSPKLLHRSRSANTLAFKSSGRPRTSAAKLGLRPAATAAAWLTVTSIVAGLLFSWAIFAFLLSL